MFDETEPMNFKSISMSMMDDDGNTITVTNRYDFDTSWPKISYQFYCFLRGMGYQIDLEDVGADVEA